MEHPITPPPELVQQWNQEVIGTHFKPYGYSEFIATRAAQWGADQELEACEKYWMTHGISPQGVVAMRYARRPQPPSLKEQALEALERQCLRSISPLVSTSDLDTIRRALEALPDD